MLPSANGALTVASAPDLHDTYNFSCDQLDSQDPAVGCQPDVLQQHFAKGPPVIQYGGMKAAVLNQIPGELVIEDVTVDKPGPNEVLIQTVHAGLCHSDLHFMEGHWETKLPAVMGHESAGIVQAVGQDVAYCKPGDRVIT